MGSLAPNKKGKTKPKLPKDNASTADMKIKKE
jgi:hypothetical protein